MGTGTAAAPCPAPLPRSPPRAFRAAGKSLGKHLSQLAPRTEADSPLGDAAGQHVSPSVTVTSVSAAAVLEKAARGQAPGRRPPPRKPPPARGTGWPGLQEAGAAPPPACRQGGTGPPFWLG